MNIFLSVNFSICFGCSKEPSHWDGSFEYQQNMFWLRNKKKIFLITHSFLKDWKTSKICNERFSLVVDKNKLVTDWNQAVLSSSWSTAMPKARFSKITMLNLYSLKSQTWAFRTGLSHSLVRAFTDCMRNVAGMYVDKGSFVCLFELILYVPSTVSQL